MEDIAPESVPLVLPNEKDGGEKKDQESKEGEESSTGFVKKFLPKLVFGKESEEQEEGQEDDRTQKSIVNDDKVEEKRGGVITNLLSNLVSPRAGEVTKQRFETPDGDSKEEDLGNRGGIVRKIVSNLFDHSRGEEREKREVEEGRKKPKIEEEQGRRGGIIDNLVSHLKSDDAIPTSDEATILINSIVRD
ncbi:hypothetical protein UlMin_000929 [Ulmus minor]